MSHMGDNEVASRLEFVTLARNELYSIAELCRTFGISRPTGYRWLKRFEQEGLQGLQDRSSRPHSTPTKTNADVEADIIKLRMENPHLGPLKLQALMKEKGYTKVPGSATISRIIKRAGLSAAK